MAEASTRRTRAHRSDGADPSPMSAFPPPQILLNAQAAQAMLVGLDLIQSNARIWRGLINVLCDQQDAMLGAVRTQMSSGAHDDAQTRAMPGFDATAFFAPLLAARKTYEAMGEAVLDAQRQTLSAFNSQAKSR